MGADGVPGFLPFGEVKGRFDLVEGKPFEFGDFVFLAGGELFGIFGAGEEKDDGFEDVQAGDVVGEGVAGGFVEDDIEVGFFFDFAEGGFGLGFAGFDVAFGKAGETVVLVDDEDFAVMDDDSTARSFWGGVIGSVDGGLGGGKVGNVGVGSGKGVGEVWGGVERVGVLGIIHGNIIYYSAGVW